MEEKYGNRLFAYNVILPPEHTLSKSAMDDEIGIIRDAQIRLKFKNLTFHAQGIYNVYNSYALIYS